MKFIKRLAVVMVTLLLAAVVVPVLTVNADTTTTSSSDTTGESSSSQAVQTKALSSAYVVYGAGVAQSDRSSIGSALGVSDNYKTLTSTASDYNQYIGNGTTSDAAMISSVSIAPADPGSGVKVNIVKYDGNSNITKVTAQQYAMVATMAGVNDVIITVTANKAVSGEAALAGVYKALATDGITLSSANTSAANGVLEATQPAIDANSGDSKYPGKLMAAVGSVSKELAQQRQDNNQYATKDEVQAMLDKALSKYGIANSTPSSAQTTIVNALIQVQKAPVSSSKTYISNVSNVTKTVKNSVGDAMAKIGDFANSADGKALMAKYGNIFQRIWAQIVAFVSGLFN